MKRLKRHPLSAKYPDITGAAWDDFLANLKEYGPGERKIIIHEKMVLDGWQLYRGCLELGKKPKFAALPKGADAVAFIETANDFRRHESAELQQQRREERRQRVKAAHDKGQSVRAIAEQENVSIGTIQKDLVHPGVYPNTPEKNLPISDGENNSDQTRESQPPTSAKTIGRDGKQYPSKKRCVACTTKQRKLQPLPDNCPDCQAPKMKRTANAKPPKPAKPSDNHVRCPHCQGKGWLPADKQGNAKTFIKPTVEQIAAYCKERNNGIDAQAFFDFYQSKGWVVGKAPMRDWQSAVKNWERNDFRKNGSSKPGFFDGLKEFASRGD